MKLGTLGEENAACCHEMDFLWLLARIPSSHSRLLGSVTGATEQRVLGWTAFNVMAEKNKTPSASAVGY